METEVWDRLSAWHNAWLVADGDERRRLRHVLESTEPDLLALADALISDDALPDGFLETPALVVAAAHLAQDAGLPPGARIGPYQIVGLIGSGGMGLVYRATDERLGRDIALKMLLPLGAPDETQINRFIQEARLTASIDHPNVVRVYDVGLVDGRPYLVFELLDGATLRTRLDHGALPVADARRIVTEIARGLVAAHAAGLVHRDLKPENIFLTSAGATKILDFGIAKLTPDAAGQRAEASTLTGILLGTAGYLAPEQIRGDRSAGSPADLFALGSMLFEMLAGHRAFAGESTVDTLHAILHEPAPDLRTGRPDVPAGLAEIGRRLLAKAPTDRFHSAADLVWALEQPDAGTPAAPASQETRTRSARVRLAPGRIAAALLAGAALFGALWLGGQPRPDASAFAPVRFSVTLPAGTTLASSPAVSPDGRRIGWSGLDTSGTPRLYVRDLSAAEATLITGTEGARHPFWSPDGTSLGFFAGGKLKKVAAVNGTPVSLADSVDARGGTWSPAGVIVFQPIYRDSPLMKVSQEGGPVEPVTTLDPARGETGHLWPAFLPDGRHFLYLIRSTIEGRRGIYVGSIDAPATIADEPLLAGDSGAQYVLPHGQTQGVLVTVANGQIEARPFDPVRRQFVGDGLNLGIAAVPSSPHHAALVSASDGTIVFGSAPIPWGHLFSSILRDGSDLRLGAKQELGGFPRISPDGRRLARSKVDPLAGDPDIWIDDLERGTELRLTTSREFDVMPIWSPDGRQVAYRTGPLDRPSIGISDSNGGGASRTVACPAPSCEPTDWMPDGRTLLVTVRGAEVWSVPLDDASSAAPLLAESYPVRGARVSSDGRWIVYVSEETGRPQVSIKSLVGPPRRVIVSADTGDQPVWRRDGRELFFADARGRLHSVSISVTTDGGIEVGAPRPLSVPSLGERHWGTTYDVSIDGRRIYFPHALLTPAPSQFGVLTGWGTLAGQGR